MSGVTDLNFPAGNPDVIAVCAALTELAGSLMKGQLCEPYTVPSMEYAAGAPYPANWSTCKVSRAALLIFTGVICAVGFSSGASPNFVAPRILFAGGIDYPDQASAGVVELFANLDKNGYVTSLHTVRTVPSLTASVANAVTGWMFSPAFLDGTAVDSTISIYAAFNPGDLPNKPVSLTAPDWSWQSERPSFIPPEVSSASYAAYPGSAPGGTVVLDISVTRTGRVSRSAAIYTTPALTNSAVVAAGQWEFAAGKFEGNGVASHAVAAFVFRAPAIKNAS